MNAKELRSALLIVWRASSMIVLAILLAPWIFTPAQIAAVVPPCEYQAKYHRECPFCGMTAAFYEIREGRFSNARSLNGGAPALFSLFLVNELSVFLFWLSRSKQGRERALAC